MSKRRERPAHHPPSLEWDPIDACGFSTGTGRFPSSTWDGTPSWNEKWRPTCIDRNGRPKKAYRTRNEAEATRDYEQCRSRTTLRVYHCDACRQWHLTSTPRW